MRSLRPVATIAQGAICVLSLLAPVAMGQNAVKQSPPVEGSYLIAWSEFQKPIPMPSPISSIKESRQPEQALTSAEAPPPQIFLGVIERDGDRFKLRLAEGISYTIDDSDGVKMYDGRAVKLVAGLDPKTRLLHVLIIGSHS
ncbi:MAG TPA: hypothetical protein VKV39_20065 [Candidatus Sulfotelmatobacter sp.]|nr:hypothetical protein [Candidatus Sulfotelmatobacter sp.]